MKIKLLHYSLPLLMALNLNANSTYNVDDLIVQALKNSPNLKISTAEYKASQSRKNIASSAYLPKVDMLLSIAQNGVSNVPSTSMINDSTLLGNLTLKQLVYDFGKTSSNVASFSYESHAFEMRNLQNISDKKRDVKIAYYKVLQVLALIDVQKENVKLNKSQLYRSKRYFEAGIRTKIDISDARVELIKAKINLKNREYDLAIAYANLDEIIGSQNIINDYKVYAPVLDLTDIYASLNEYSLNLNDSIEYSYKHRYELKNSLETLKSTKAKAKLALSDYYPALYIGASYTRQEVDKLKNSIPQDQWQTSINLGWNLYQGGNTDALSQEKAIQIQISQEALNTKKLLIKKETTQAYINVYKAKDAVELSQSLLKVSNEKFHQAGKRYEHGLSDYIELQQARQGYIDAKASLIISYYNYYQAIAFLDNAIGK